MDCWQTERSNESEVSKYGHILKSCPRQDERWVHPMNSKECEQRPNGEQWQWVEMLSLTLDNAMIVG